MSKHPFLHEDGSSPEQVLKEALRKGQAPENFLQPRLRHSRPARVDDEARAGGRDWHAVDPQRESLQLCDLETADSWSTMTYQAQQPLGCAWTYTIFRPARSSNEKDAQWKSKVLVYHK